MSFVRSTQLDAWSWDQLRVMKVGGNLKALEYFRQHGGMKDDLKGKYTSRAAQGYRDVLAKLAAEDARLYPNMVLADQDDVAVGDVAQPPGSPTEDFFATFEKSSTASITPKTTPTIVSNVSSVKPAVKTSSAGSTLKKSSIGARKPAASANKLGAKKASATSFAVAEAHAKKQEAEDAVREQRRLDDERNAVEREREEQERREAALTKILATGGVMITDKTFITQ